MGKLISIISVLLLSCGVSAETELLHASGEFNPEFSVSTGEVQLLGKESRFTTITNLFKKGKEATLEDVMGLRPGRCYRKKSPSEAKGVALVIKEVTLKNDDGPLFDDEVELRGFLVEHHANPKYYDEMTEDVVDELNKTLDGKTHIVLSKDFYSRNSSLVMMYKGPEGKKVEVALRKHKENIVGYALSEMEGHEGMVHFASCYFFDVK